MVTAPLGLLVCAWLAASPEFEGAEALFSQFKYAEARAVRFASAGALGLTGVLMWALGGEAQAQVQPVPVPGGVAVAGRF